MASQEPPSPSDDIRIPVIGASTDADRSGRVIAYNLRRLMAKLSMTYDDVVEATGLDSRTIRSVARGDKTPQARTLNRLSSGLGVSTDQLFLPPTGLSLAAFDAATNPAVDRVRIENPNTFEGWTSEDFAQLASRFGTGGELTDAGVLAEAERLNKKRVVLAQASIILETDQAALLTELITLLYDRVVVSD